MIPPEAVERFRADCEALTGGAPSALGVAVSGGPDSLALLLLAAAAYPGKVHAATVDHGLREESAREARFVAAICEKIAVPHNILDVEWQKVPVGNIQAEARQARYRALGAWALDRDIRFVASGHHVNDQAETVLMRLARGAGVSGLAGARRSIRLAFEFESGAAVDLIRPLLDWPRDDLGRIVAAAGLIAVDDPSNSSERFDRTRARALLAGNDWLQPERLAASASNLAEAEEALDWVARGLFAERHTLHEDGSVTLDPRNLPRELQRRLLLRGLAYFTNCTDTPGPKLITLLDALLAGRTATLAGVKVVAGDQWRLSLAPPHRS